MTTSRRSGWCQGRAGRAAGFVAAAALVGLAGCRSPGEERLAALEARLAELARRLEAVEAAPTSTSGSVDRPAHRVGPARGADEAGGAGEAGGEPPASPRADRFVALLEADGGPEAERACLALIADGLVDERTSDGRTPLFVAARAGRPALVEALLARGADPAARVPPRGETPLGAAAAGGSFEALELLAARPGVDPTVVSGPYPEPGPTWARAGDLARAAGHADVASALEEAASDWDHEGRDVAILATITRLEVRPLGSAAAGLELALGAPAGWGSLRVALPAGAHVREGPGDGLGVVPARATGAFLRVPLRWRVPGGAQAGAWTTHDLVVNKPNSDEPVLSGVLHLGPGPSEVLVTLRPHAPPVHR